MPNRLAEESSPYLAQHGDNPVDWYPWGSEALERARDEDRPILLSIGYSACHWCHVMERESFEDQETAEMMNRLFVNVKVDREERPDLDQIYQLTVQVMGRGGGWPLTVFLTPKLEPFYAGTYFPPVPRHGMPSFRTVMEAVADAYANKRGEVEESAADLTRIIGEVTRGLSGEGEGVPADLLERAVRALSARVDETNGGFGTRPKFPNSLALDVLCRAHHDSGDAQALEWLEAALSAMRAGGVYDQIGWGFHRYSTDERWLVPHFEKMLYDNALLAQTYLSASLATEKPHFADTAVEVLRWAEREMRDPAGGFYATQDADSEGEEGRFFVWTPAQLEMVLGPELAEVAALRWGVTPAGNFEGATVLHRARDVGAVAREVGRDADVVEKELEEARDALLAARSERVAPARDDKILAGWNGLAISAFARVGSALGDDALVGTAREGLRFAKKELFVDGELRRVFKDGQARIGAFLEDYGALAGAAIDVHQATLDPDALDFAALLVDGALDRFWDAESAAFHFAEARDDLVVRAHDVYDGATPSGTSTICHALLRLGALLGEARYEEIAERALSAMAEPAAKNPFAFANTVTAMDRYLRGATMVVVVGEADDDEVKRMLGEARRAYDPNLLLWRVGSGDEESPAASLIGDGVSHPSPVAFVCRNRTCGLPLTTAAALADALAR